MAANQLTAEAIAARKRERDRVWKAAWRKSHPERNRAIQAKWRKAHPDEHLAKVREYAAAHRDEKREYNARYRAEHIMEIQGHCAGRKEEKSAVAKKWYQKNRDAQRAYAIQYGAKHPKEKALIYKRFVGREANRMRLLVSDAGTRAKRKGLAFDGLRDIAKTTPTECGCCGLTLNYSKRLAGTGPGHRSPSLDRVDSSKGYTADNVRVICWRCNDLKGSATIEELETVIAYMRRESLAPAV